MAVQTVDTRAKQAGITTGLSDYFVVDGCMDVTIQVNETSGSGKSNGCQIQVTLGTPAEIAADTALWSYLAENKGAFQPNYGQTGVGHILQLDEGYTGVRLKVWDGTWTITVAQKRIDHL